ncbi:transposase family protein [Streptomyces sp. NPDC050625]|uniref:transposase family protein n=1 Tax=Streptomyces sp. NPDC050625 TaxID=3154629 RepID=UPI003418C92D
MGDLLPRLAAVQVERVEAGGDLLRITARIRDDASVACPGCGQSSDCPHSRYERHVADEAVGGREVVIDLSVRCLYCENPACEKVIFVEQVTGPAEGGRRGPLAPSPQESRSQASSGASPMSWSMRQQPARDLTCCDFGTATT